MRIRLALVVMVAALAAGALAAPLAAAIPASVRLEGSLYRVMPTTRVDIPAKGGKVVDSDGSAFTTTAATALNAIDRACQLQGLPWDMGVDPSMGAFINSFDDQGMDPATFADWWQFSVNGFSPSVGAAGLTALAGDRYTLFQNPDSGFPPKNSVALVARLKSSAVKRGQSVRITIVGDDLSKVNGRTDAERFDITDPAQIQAPAAFAAVTGATVHVGSLVLHPVGNTVAVKLPVGHYRVWVEKQTDSSTVYVRSVKTLVTVGR